VALSKKLRITKRYQEIFKVVSQSVGDDKSFIWKSRDEKRVRFPMKIHSVDQERNRIELTLAKVSKDFSVGEAVYLKLSFRDAAFKAQVIERSDSELTLMFPEEMALEENRSQPREYFHPSEGKVAQLQSQELTELVVVCDISRGGMAFFVPQKIATRFEVNTKIALIMLGPSRLRKPLKADVLFFIPTEIQEELTKKKGFKIGVRFESLLDEDVLERFILRQFPFSIDEKQLVRDQEFRERVKVNVAQIRNELQRRPAFRKFLETLELGTSETHYLRQHIHLLCQVLTGLGTRIGWISDRSIDKLIYVSYLHDIRFMKYPNLARIPDLRTFEKIKDTLSKEEQSAFLEAPSYAADMARQDLGSFPDAIKILTQQKELPDGSGYPQALMASQISPLGALFIVSHYLVDYIIDFPDWTIEEFIKKNRTRFKGGYFSKIMTALQGEVK
jgi:HD-GYP domain-containing protein (c-di-GMP phosphodiesterase class II)